MPVGCTYLLSLITWALVMTNSKAASVPSAIPSPLSAFKASYPNEDLRVLQGFLELKDGDLNKAIEQFEQFKAWRKDMGPVTVSDIEPQLRSGSYMITLEPPAEGGSHASSYTGSPVMYMNGMIKGSRKEMTTQVVYAAERAIALLGRSDDTTHRQVKLVINARGPHFRFPDGEFRTTVFTTMRERYPCVADLRVIFMDVPGIMHAGLSAIGKVLPFMKGRFEVVKAKQFVAQDPDMQAFLKHGLATWDPQRSKLAVDVDMYVKQQRTQEGVQSCWE